MFHWLKFLGLVGASSIAQRDRLQSNRNNSMRAKKEALPKVRALIASTAGHQRMLHEANLKRLQDEIAAGKSSY